MARRGHFMVVVYLSFIVNFTRCVEGANPMTNGNYIYTAVDIEKSWNNARTYCVENHLGQLAYLETVHEINLVQDWVNNYLVNSQFGPWLGVSDIEQEGVYLTVGGQNVTDILWRDGEPDGEYEDCLRLSIMSSTIYDASCSEGRAFVCKRSAPTTVATTTSATTLPPPTTGPRIVRNQYKKLALFTLLAHDAIANSPILKHSSVVSHIVCAQECLRYPLCRSFNVESSHVPGPKLCLLYGLNQPRSELQYLLGTDYFTSSL